MSNKPRLRFNRRKALSDYKKAVKAAANQLLKELYTDIKADMTTSEGAKNLHRMREDEEKIFRRTVVGYAHAIMDSYGTGSKMDTHYNAALSDYKGSDLYNPSRKGKAIAGRPKGSYTNIFGETEVSSGKREGISVEKFYKPQSPSYAFQRAEVWFFKGKRVNEVLTQYIGEWISGLSQYFEYR